MNFLPLWLPDVFFLFACSVCSLNVSKSSRVHHMLLPFYLFVSLVWVRAHIPDVSGPIADPLEVYVDVFYNNWNIKIAVYDVSTAISRTGFVILFVGCPLIYASKLQS